MPSAGTKPRSFRLDEELWTACVEKAERTGINITSVVRQRLEEWIAESDEKSARDFCRRD